jgi:hypothetical protein
MILFITLPFLGFYLGMQYQQKITITTPVVSEAQKTPAPTVMPTLTPILTPALTITQSKNQITISPSPTPTKNSIYVKFSGGSGGSINIPGQKCTITSVKTGYNQTVTNSTVLANVSPADDYIVNCVEIAGYNNNTMWTNDNDLWPNNSNPYTNRFVVFIDKPTYLDIIYYQKSQ